MATDELPPEIVQWLTDLKISQYAPKAKIWCKKVGAVHVSEILDNLEEFSDALQLKVLEKKRMMKVKEGNMTQGYPGVAREGPHTPSTTVGANSITSSSAGAAAAADAPAAEPTRQIQWSFGPSSEPEKYGVVGELGSGATATVYECVHDGKFFAAKTISLSKLRLQPHFNRLADSMKREVQILRVLRHRRIVSLFEVIEVPEGAAPDKLILVMELVTGTELFEKIVEHGALREHPVARYVFIQISEGLQYIHSKDIVYRDLKPENILVDGKKSRGDFIEIKLADFGHSKLINDGYSTALTKVGTQQYWAPEVSDCDRTRKPYSQAVDLWSLGVVLYVMVIGRYPFNETPEQSIDEQIRAAQVVFPLSALGTEVSEPARDLVRSLIKVNPLQRLSIPQCLMHRWVAMEGQVQTGLLKLATEGHAVEERVILPYDPEPGQRQQLKHDFDHFMNKFRCSVQLKRPESGPDRGKAIIVADMHAVELAKVVEARQELLQITKHTIRGHVEWDIRTLSGGSAGAPSMASAGARMPPVPEANSVDGASCTAVTPSSSTAGTFRSPFRIMPLTLRVDPEHGAGLMLQPEQGGMRIERVLDIPGQPGLQDMDLILKINGHSLRGDQVEHVFGTHFADGVVLEVRRAAEL